jgi:hypothetical protein
MPSNIYDKFVNTLTPVDTLNLFSPTTKETILTHFTEAQVLQALGEMHVSKDPIRQLKDFFSEVAAKKPLTNFYRYLGQDFTYVRDSITHQGKIYENVSNERRYIHVGPSQYGVAFTELSRLLMKIAYPRLMSRYQVEAYNLFDSSSELYIKLSKSYNNHASLYVPLPTLKSKRRDVIEKRNSDYLYWYTKTTQVWGEMQNDVIVNAFFKDLALGKLSDKKTRLTPLYRPKPILP